MNPGDLTDYSRGLLDQSWPLLKRCTFRPLSGGLINSTWHATSQTVNVVVQWVNPIFSNEVNYDIKAVTQFLKARGVASMTLIDTVEGEPSLPVSSGSWRVFEYISGHPISGKIDFSVAASSLADFHSALSDLEYEFRHTRDIHNSKKHLISLAMSLEANRDHPLYSQVSLLGEKVSRLLTPYSIRGNLPMRVVHGDPKLENFILTQNGAVLIDLDTVGRHDFIGEIGDALRSWCREASSFNLELFEIFIKGYFKEGNLPISPEELALLSKAPWIIALELSARFLTDALNESYFGWDSSLFESRGEHNLSRAKGEIEFAMSAMDKNAECEDVISRNIKLKKKSEDIQN